MFCKLYKVIVTDDDNFDSAFLTLMLWNLNGIT